MTGGLMESWLALLSGLLIGSFLNVCIHRLPKDLSVVRPRSHCPTCARQLTWYENIPVVSFLALRGRCRTCRTRISVRYPIVEILTGAFFFLSFQIFGPGPQAVKACLFCALCIGLVFADLEERILPDEFTLGGATAGLALSLWLPMEPLFTGIFLPAHWGERALSFAEALFGGGFASFLLWLIGEVYYRLRGREGLGLGDVKMMGMVGAFLGLQGALLTVMLGSLLGSVVGLLYIFVTKKDSSAYELPFGSFLGAAALFALLGGQPFFSWYWRLGQ